MRRRNQLTSYEKTVLAALLGLTIITFLLPVLVPSLSDPNSASGVIRTIAGVVLITVVLIIFFKFVLS